MPVPRKPPPPKSGSRLTDHLLVLGGRLGDERRQRGLRQQDVASALGWPPSRLSAIEAGSRVPHPVDLRDLLTYYGLSFDAVAADPAGDEVARYQRARRERGRRRGDP